MKKSLLATAVAMTLGVGAAQAAPLATSGTFTMYDPTGAVNNVDSDLTGFVDTAAGTWGVASTNTYFGLNWTAVGGTLYTSNFTVDTQDPGAGVSGGSYTSVVVGPGQIGGSIKFNWGATTGIDVIQVWDVSGSTWTSTDALCSGDASAVGFCGDGILGTGMIDGPFPGFNANFDFTAVPVPAAVWLFGSGLVGLVGVARRRRKSA